MSKKKASEEANLQEKIDKTAKLFDVKKPGKTAAGATSRPIIVGHSMGITQDPMVAPADKKKVEPTLAAPSEPQPLGATVKVKVEPLNHDVKPEPEVVDTESVATPEPETQSSPESEKAPEPSPATKESAAVDGLVNEVSAHQADKKQKQDIEHKTEEIEHLITTKEFFVPIGAASRRRSHHRIILVVLLSLVLIAVCLNFAIDAEAIDIGFNALTDIL